jgi:hypothetical protein
MKDMIVDIASALGLALVITLVFLFTGAFLSGMWIMMFGLLTILIVGSVAETAYKWLSSLFSPSERGENERGG